MKLLDLPVSTLLANVPQLLVQEDMARAEGASWWSALEATLRGIPCEHCREEGLSLISAMHDLINLRTGKALHNMEAAWPYNGWRLAKSVQDGKSWKVLSPPQGHPNTWAVGDPQQKVYWVLGIGRYDWAQVIAQALNKALEEGKDQPDPITLAQMPSCSSEQIARLCSQECVLPHSLKDPWLPDDDEDDDWEPFMRKLYEALRREGKMRQPSISRGAARLKEAARQVSRSLSKINRSVEFPLDIEAGELTEIQRELQGAIRLLQDAQNELGV